MADNDLVSLPGRIGRGRRDNERPAGGRTDVAIRACQFAGCSGMPRRRSAAERFCRWNKDVTGEDINDAKNRKRDHKNQLQSPCCRFHILSDPLLFEPSNVTDNGLDLGRLELALKRGHVFFPASDDADVAGCVRLPVRAR